MNEEKRNNQKLCKECAQKNIKPILKPYEPHTC